jgi:hypothetical protein
MIEGKQLHMDNSGASSLDICYIRDAQEVVRFDPIFLCSLSPNSQWCSAILSPGLIKASLAREIGDRWEQKRAQRTGKRTLPEAQCESATYKKEGCPRSGATDGQHLSPKSINFFQNDFKSGELSPKSGRVTTGRF